jgi:hypothetical protein
MTRAWRLLSCVAGLLAFAGIAVARDPNHPMVRADSPVMRAIEAQPLTADRYPLFVAMYKFNLARDTQSEQAVREYLWRTALLQLADLPFQPTGTIGSIVHEPAALPQLPEGLNQKLVASALPARVAVSEDTARALRGEYGETFRQVTPGLWLGRTASGPSHARLLIEVQNTTRTPMTNVDTQLRVAGSGDARPAYLRCSSLQPFSRLAPGEKSVMDCVLHATEVAARLDALAQAVREWREDPSRIPLHEVHVAFADLGVIVGSNGAIQVSHERAAVDAREQLEQAGCLGRGSCMGEAMETLRAYSILFLIPAGAVLGALAGAILRRRRRVAMPAGPASPTLRPTAAPRSVLGLAVLGAYLAFLGLCATGVVYDTAWSRHRSGMDGVVGFLASGLAGFPESVVILFAVSGSDTAFVGLCWLAAVLNVWILGDACRVWGRRR